MKDNQRYNYHDRIIDEAADWFARLQDTELSSEDREAFADWLSASPEHVREYLALTNLHTDISELPSTRSVGDLIEMARLAHAENVVSLYEQKAPAPARFSSAGSAIPAPDTGRAGRVKRLVGLAACIAIITLASVWWLHSNPNTAVYTTSIGEQKSFPLPDGSVVTLNAVSKLRIRYTERYRDVQLLSGEALFIVAKNRLRPFRVLTNDSVIQAVGTQFNVYHRRADTTVTVVEGTVEIRPAVSQLPAQNSLSQPLKPPRLAPQFTGEGAAVRGSSQVIRVTKGQRAHIGAQDAPITVSAADAAVDTAWRERRLTFESRPLGEIVAEFNLYNQAPIEIRDAALNATQVSGSFNANDPQSFALFLEEAKLAKAKVESNRILLLPLAAR
jgi:transmembrane sensor